MADMQVTILGEIHSTDSFYVKEREQGSFQVLIMQEFENLDPPPFLGAKTPLQIACDSK